MPKVDFTIEIVYIVLLLIVLSDTCIPVWTPFKLDK